MIFAITGLETTRQRAEESEAIVNWAFRQFAEKKVTTAGQRVAAAEVWMGAEDSVGLVTTEDTTLLLPIIPGASLEAEVVYTGPLQAPISKGQQLAELIIRPEGLPEHRMPLVAESDVATGGFMSRMMTVSNALLKRLGDGTAEGTM